MTAFDEAWLAAHQAKMAGLARRPVAVAPILDHIAFSIDRCLPLMNGSTGLLRSHWTKRRVYQRSLSNEIARLLPVKPMKPTDPALVTVIRYGIRLADHDNHVSSLKPLLDCLVVRSKQHPFGLGLIYDDDPAHMKLDVSCIKISTLREQRTEVTVSPLD